MRILGLVAVAWLVLPGALAACHAAEKRVALVMGNSAYKNVGRLPNPVNDAAAMAALFRSAGFAVDEPPPDLDRAQMKRAISDFADTAHDSDIAVVYFAGHGIEVGGVNYLIPVNAELAHDFDVEDESISLDYLLRAIEPARRLRLVILDACRSNPFRERMKLSSRTIGRGLKAIEPDAVNTLVAYAAKAGSTAADGDREHSPFTAALLEHLATPGLDVRFALGRVRDSVMASTRREQEPFSYGSLGGQAVAIVEAAGGAAASAAEAGRVWGQIEHTTNLQALDDYIGKFGDVAIYGPLARERRAELARVAEKPPRLTGEQTAMLVEPRPSGTPLAAAQERALKPGQSFLECDKCPEMVVVPAGSFTMGSPATEEDRNADEGPQHVVTFAKPFAVGRIHATRDQYAAFVNETKYVSDSQCFWGNPGFAQDGSHPVVCVSRNDAQAYVDWLAKKTGKPYRLMSEAEFEYAARAQTRPGAYARYWFGDNVADLCTRGNFCLRGTTPAGQYPPNPFGLQDMAGNAWQLTADCYFPTYAGAPADGSAWGHGGTCLGGAVARGGSWSISSYGSYARARSRAASRQRASTKMGDYETGFRVARTLAQ